MKERLSKPVVYGIVVILIIGFAFWGVGDFTRSNLGDPLASVGRTNIYPTQFSRTFRNAMQNVLQQNPDMTYDQARKAGLDKGILEQLTQRAAFDEFLSQIGLVIDPKRIHTLLENYDQFLSPLGVLEENRVRNYVLDNGYGSLQEFVDETGNNLLREDFLLPITHSMVLPDWIMDGFLEMIIQERQVTYVTLVPGDLSRRPPTPTEEEIITFYAQNGSLFVTPETRSLNVLFLDANDVTLVYKPSEDDITLFYEAHRTTFGSPETRSLKLLVFPNQASAQTFVDRAQNLNKSAFETHLEKAIAAQPSIRNLALENVSFDNLEASGEHIAQEAFAMELMTVKGPFKGIVGPSVLYLEGITPSSIPPLSQVRGEIVDALSEDEKDNALITLTQNVEEALLEEEDLKNIAQRDSALTFFSLDKVEQNFLPYNNDDTLPQNLDITLLLDQAFRGVLGALPDPINLSQGQRAWISITGVTQQKPLSLEQARSQVTQRIQRQRNSKIMQEVAQDIVEKSNDRASFQRALSEYQLASQDSPFLNRLTSTDLFDKRAIDKIFALPEKKASFTPSSSGEALLIFQIAESKSANISDDAKERIKKQVSLSFLRETFEAFSQTLKIQYGSWKNESLIESALTTNNPY